MTKIIYGSETGNTETVAEMILGMIQENIPTEMIDVASAIKEDFTEPDLLIIGSSTWGNGELPGGWEGAIPLLDEVDLSGKSVALFGLGDQEGFSEEFADAIGILYEKLKEKGAAFVGFTSTEGYDHDESRAEIEPGTFCGLILDEDNQDDMTAERVEKWVETIRTHLK